MTKVSLKSLRDQGVLQKLVVSILLMAIIPLVSIFYILHTEVSGIFEKIHIRWLFFFILCSISIGYMLSRKIVVSIIRLAKDVEYVTHADLRKQIEVTDNDEVKIVAQYFNEVTDELEKNIKDLQESKELIQDVLSRIGHAMVSFRRIESIFELTIETLTNALGATSGAIMLYENEILKIMVSYGLPETLKKSLTIKKGEGVIGLSIKKNKSQNVLIDDSKEMKVEIKKGIAKHSLICVPLIYHNRVVGTISVHDAQKKKRFSKDDLFLVENLAHQTAIAIENRRLNQDIEKTYVETISTLALAVEAKDPYTRGHSKRVAEYCLKLADEFKLDEKTKSTLQDAAILHDIGKIGIKDKILLKPGKLTQEERLEMQRHPIIGENIIKPIHSLSKVAYLVRHHHEQLDGKGYPDGLKGDELILPLRILTVADVYDAMTSSRPYRKALSKKEAEEELVRQSGTHFDPEVVQVFMKII